MLVYLRMSVQTTGERGGCWRRGAEYLLEKLCAQDLLLLQIFFKKQKQIKDIFIIGNTDAHFLLLSLLHCRCQEQNTAHVRNGTCCARSCIVIHLSAYLAVVSGMRMITAEEAEGALWGWCSAHAVRMSSSEREE